MAVILTAIFYISLFLVVYTQVFFLITFFENRKKIIIRGEKETELRSYPSVTVIVPCFNEERTVKRSVMSLLALGYPKEKLKLFLVDDGSTDGTWREIETFRDNPNVQIFHKDNGGKYTALNLGLNNLKSDFVGCLDADSTVDSAALARIMSYFEKDPSAMAVVPSVVVDNPKGIVQNAQRVEYNMGIYMKKMLGFLGAINVTPGPFTIFKKEVFVNLGPYRHAHNTEDMEIAYRMQKNHYKIDHCNDAYVYTKTPYQITKLFKQRLRWIYGFINNSIDYRGVLFDRKYGNFSIFTVPVGIATVFTVGYLFIRTVYNLSNYIFSKILEFKIVGFNLTSAGISHNFDLFFLNTKSSFFITLGVYCLVITSILLGRKMTQGTKEKWGFPYQIVYFFLIFSVVGPFWILKAIYNTLTSRVPAWR